MLTITLLLALAALVTAIVALMGRCPLTVPVLLLAIIALLQSLPLR